MALSVVTGEREEVDTWSGRTGGDSAEDNRVAILYGTAACGLPGKVPCLNDKRTVSNTRFNSNLI
jgi:hypothetical protein